MVIPERESPCEHKGSPHCHRRTCLTARGIAFRVVDVNALKQSGQWRYVDPTEAERQRRWADEKAARQALRTSKAERQRQWDHAEDQAPLEKAPPAPKPETKPKRRPLKTSKGNTYWPLTHEQGQLMLQRQAENRARYVPAEEWMLRKLATTGVRWTRNAQWGFRLFDFWCARLGLVVEVDGDTHVPEWDATRDKEDLERSGILVIRVPNYDEQMAARALQIIAGAEEWNERRVRLGLLPMYGQGQTKVVVPAKATKG